MEEEPSGLREQRMEAKTITRERTEIERRIDIIEEDIAKIDVRLLKLLLQDKTTKKNILWCTTDYENLGSVYDEHNQILLEAITGLFYNVIQPRAAKAKEIQEMRSKNKAEVFTKAVTVNAQNNLIDDAWFGRKDVFNHTIGQTVWIATEGKIEFPKGKTWRQYVDDKRLEITCGEAPYLVSRYDTTTGDLIPTFARVGLFDRKMRIVTENCETDEEWLKWSLRALKSVYGYEFQGDSVLIARENLLYDYIDYYKERFHAEPPLNLLREVANIIAWNIWQMDGLKCVVPYSCHDEEVEDRQLSFTDWNKPTERKPCPGCARGDIHLHNGIYCRIFDWTNKCKSIPFISLFKKEEA
jgi:hypothetical protein